MLSVKEAKERSQLMNQIDGLYGQANQLFVTSSSCTDPQQAEQFFTKGQALADAAEQLETDYYNRFPNCLSKHLHR